MNLRAQELSKKYMPNDLKIEQKAGRYGIRHLPSGKVLLPCIYDNLFLYGKGGLFAVHKDGKIGAVRINESSDIPPEWIAACEYDTMDTFSADDFCDLIFSKPDEVKYYNETTQMVWSFHEVRQEHGYLFAEDAKYCYILERRSGNLLWREPQQQKDLERKPIFRYDGYISDGAIFYDFMNNRTIIPSKDGYRIETRFCANFPIIVNGKYLMSVSTAQDGIHIADLSHDDVSEGGIRLNIALKAILTKKDGSTTEKQIAVYSQVTKEALPEKVRKEFYGF